VAQVVSTYCQTIDNLLVAIDDVPGDHIIVVCGDIFHDRNVLDALVQLFARLMSGLRRVVRTSSSTPVPRRHCRAVRHPGNFGPVRHGRGRFLSQSLGTMSSQALGIGVVTVHDVSADGEATLPVPHAGP
jgi:NDP-sugar pyrophosphorylase family protein